MIFARDSDPAGPSSIRSGGLIVELPPDWQRAAKDSEVPGLWLGYPMTLVPSQRKGGEAMLVGTSAGMGRKTLLPLALRLSGKAPQRGVPVELDELRALRYERLRVSGVPIPLTLFAAPTTIGVATVVCRPSAQGGREFLERCEEVASTLRLYRGRAVRLDPSPVLASQ